MPMFSEPLARRRVALLCHSGPPVMGGVERLLGAQARWLKKYGADVAVFVGEGDVFHPGIPVTVLDGLSSAPPDPIDRANGRGTGRFRDRARFLQDTLRAHLDGYNTWIVHNLLTMPFNLPLTAALHDLVADSEACVFGWTHDIAWLDDQYDTPERYPWSLLCQPAPVDAYVAISRHRQTQLKTLFGPGAPPIRVVHDAVEVQDMLDLDPSMDAFYHQHHLYDDDLIALYPARLVPRKNFEKALRITHALKERGNRLHLIITGPPDPHNDHSVEYRDRLIALASKLGIRDEVIFCCREQDPVHGGPLEMSFARVKQLYRISDVLLMTSRQEGFGLPLVEAGLTGTLICCPNVDPLPEVAGDGALYFDLNSSPSRIARDVEQRLEHESTIRLRSRMRSRLTWHSIMENELLPLFEDFPLPNPRGSSGLWV